MKKRAIPILLMLSLTIASAACDLTTTLLNQDPYPAVPGDYVKLVFQIEGINGADCNDITFNLLENYPIKFNPGELGLRKFDQTDYIRNYQSSILVPYEVRVDPEALNGANPIEAKMQNKGDAPQIATFNLEIEDVRADFEVSIKNYDYTTNELTLEILNVKESNIEALTIEIPKQENIIIKGASRNIVGDLDSNEYTTADFEAIPSDGEITLELTYSDAINVRRTITKTITFDSAYFTDRKADQSTTSIWTYIVSIIIIVGIVYWVYKRRKKSKNKK
ncbi:MAG: hypothetical protein V1889_03780 [archaeon]